MRSDVAISLDSVSKCFTRAAGRRTLKELALDPTGRLRGAEHWALRDVSLDVPRGSTVGVIGANGAGKSTLLRLVAGLGKPTAGTISRPRDVAAMLTLGDTFDPLLTGRENATTAGILSGFRRRDVLASLDEVVAFAELEDVFDHPLRTYSDGMRIRLAFAVAVAAEPDALVIDEVLSVGDLRFQERCFARLEQLQARGTTLLLASHDEAIVRRLCSRVLWIDQGRVQALGEPDDVLETYAGAMRAETERRMAAAGVEAAAVGEDRIGTLEVEIADVRVRATGPADGEHESAVRLEIDLEPRIPVDEPVVSVSLHRVGDYARMLDVSSEAGGAALGRLDAPRTVVLELDGLRLPPGSYRFDVGVFERGWGYIYDYRWHAYPLEVGSEDGAGEPRTRWTLA